jgi:acetyl-CoA carboxylase carboxyltransferase component
MKHNFGMAKPEGYRKAIRLMQLADRFGLPVVTLVDTSGAFPGIQAEERGQAEAIARSTEQCLALGVPIVAAVVGEGGSGGSRRSRRSFCATPTQSSLRGRRRRWRGIHSGPIASITSAR